jgi:hypothetical protein
MIDDSSGMVEMGDVNFLAVGLLAGVSKIKLGYSGSYSSARSGLWADEGLSLKSGSKGDDGTTGDTCSRSYSLEGLDSENIGGEVFES